MLFEQHVFNSSGAATSGGGAGNADTGPGWQVEYLQKKNSGKAVYHSHVRSSSVINQLEGFKGQTCVPDRSSTHPGLQNVEGERKFMAAELPGVEFSCP